MKGYRSPQKIQQQEEREFRDRKKQALLHWKEIISRVTSGEKVSQEEISRRMQALNSADFAILRKGYQLDGD